MKQSVTRGPPTRREEMDKDESHRNLVSKALNSMR